MDQPQEDLDFLGFLGMCAESINIISSYKKIFLQITLTLILPLSVIYLSHSEISTLLITKILLDLKELGITRDAVASFDEISDALSMEYLNYWVVEATYSTFLIVLSLLSTSTVVYTVACIYSHKKPTYERVVSYTIKVWNKLMITLLCNFALFNLYNIFALLTLFVALSFSPESDTLLSRAFLSTIYILYFVGFVYISVIWQLASVVCVLEKSYGFQAIATSRTLIKGKMGFSAAIFLEINLCLGCIHLIFEKYVVLEESFGAFRMVGFGGFILVLRTLLFLFGLVVQTVVYFTSNSSINRSLSKYVNVYLGSYFPLESIVVAIEQG